MAKQDTTKVLWRVQVRMSRAHKWRNKGLFETRDVARQAAACWRDGYSDSSQVAPPVGFGNTRVVRYVRGQR